MSFFRRKQLVRMTAVAALGLGGLLGFLQWCSHEQEYVPGERTEGLVDTLSRGLPADLPEVRFVEVGHEAGLDAVHFHGRRANRLPEDMGSGIALGDVDGDGWVDLFLANAAGPLEGRAGNWPGSPATCRLYRNRANGTFEDITQRAGVGIRELCMGAGFFDMEGDGDLDLLVSAYGRCHLFRNRGDATFEDVSRAAGVDVFEGFWTGLAFADYDNDGHVDVYVCGYVRYTEKLGDGSRMAQQYGMEIPALINPSTFEPERNLLLHNRGDGTFEEVAERLGVSNPMGRSLAAVFTDLTGDGRPDIYVANDVSDNALYVNAGGGTFEDKTYQALVGDYRGAMGLAVGDYDGDLDQDFFVTHWLAQENALYTNVSADLAEEGKPVAPIFMDEADRFGLGQIALDMVGWATGFLDYDNDGRLDLFVVNGSTIPTPADRALLTPMRSHLFWNGGRERGFFEVGAVTGDFFREAWVGRGGAAFDYDLDGDEDLVIVRFGGPVALLRNDGGNRQAGLRLRLREEAGNRFALGAAVKVAIGQRAMVLRTDTQGSYLSQHAVGEVAFGVGEASSVDSIEVTWPDGTVETRGPLPVDSLVTWVKGKLPEVEVLPGKRESLLAGPADVAAKRQFYAELDRASAVRVAGRFEEAEAGYREALESWPSHEDSLYYLGNCLTELGREVEAMAVFRRLVELHPGSNRGWMQIGRLLLPGGDPALDDLEEAEAAFARSHRINGEESGPVVRLGEVALLRGELERADQLFADAAALNTRSVEARYYRGWIAWLRGEREGARRLLEEAHGLAASPAAAAPTGLHEGETRRGAALVAASVEQAATPLERWKTLAQRPPDPELEYGGLPVLANQ
ncbi:MAG: FG-GAP-like repeat-containing protein [Planctomycetota bacterium]